MSVVALSLLLPLQLLVRSAGAANMEMVGETRCFSGSNDTMRCLLGIGRPVKSEPGVNGKCPANASIDQLACLSACEDDKVCTGVIYIWSGAEGRGTCELHTNLLPIGGDPLECHVHNQSNGNISFLGLGSCLRNTTANVSVSSARQYVYNWRQCEIACYNARLTGPDCTAIEYQRRRRPGEHTKCDVLSHEIISDQMSYDTTECWRKSSQTSCLSSHDCGTPDRYLPASSQIFCAQLPLGKCSSEACCKANETRKISTVANSGIRAKALGAGYLVLLLCLAVATRLPVYVPN